MATPDDNQQSCSHSNAICNHRFKKRKELRTQEQPLVAERRQGTNYARNDPSRTRRTQEVPFNAACSHSIRKNTRFRAPLPPQHKPHATFMQPLQCILQHHVANLNLSTHMATPADNNYAAIPMRSATTDSKHAKNYAHRNNHSWRNTKEEPITLGTTPAAPAAHKRYLSSPAVATLHRKTHGFVIRLPPQVKSHTTVSHHPSLSVLLCDVKSHTTVSHHTLLSVFLCDVKSRTALHWVYCYVMSSLTPQSHTTVSHHPSLSVFLCDAKSHTTLHWVYCYRYKSSVTRKIASQRPLIINHPAIVNGNSRILKWRYCTI